MLRVLLGEHFLVAGAGHVQEIAVPVFASRPGRVAARAAGGHRRRGEVGAALVRRPTRLPPYALGEHAVHVGDLHLPAAELLAPVEAAVGREPAPDRDGQAVVAGQADVGLQEFQGAAVEVDLVAEQVRPQRADGLGCPYQLALLLVDRNLLGAQGGAAQRQHAGQQGRQMLERFFHGRAFEKVTSTADPSKGN